MSRSLPELHGRADDEQVARGRRFASCLVVLGLTASVLAVPRSADGDEPVKAASPAPVTKSGPAGDGGSDGRADHRSAAHADLPTIAFLPTLVVDDGVKRLPMSTEPDLLMSTVSIDALLADAAQDLGFTVDLTYRAPEGAERLGEIDLVAQAKEIGGVLIASSLEPRPGGDFELRLVLAEESSRALRMRVERVERVERDDLAVRAVVMLRDLVSEVGRSSARDPARSSALSGLGAPTPGVLATPALSTGRATLAANATIFGGLVGFSIHRSSGSEDPRLLYPLLAVGAGVGLGSALIVAEEWDVSASDAWYLVSGAWWPTIAGHLIYEGRFNDVTGGTARSSERWAFGMIGGASGLTLATLGLTLRGMSEGGALLAHSGGGLGLVLGGLTELAVRGDIYSVPFAGMGYGAGIGWLASAAAATIIRPSPARVLTIDLGAMVGGLGGAALASPLLFDEPTPNQQRAWIGVTAGGSIVGAGVAWFLTRASILASKREHAAGIREDSLSHVSLPMPGIVGESVAGDRRAPVLGVSWQGLLP